MFIFYENDILNKIIVTFHPIFKNVPDSNTISIDLDSSEGDILDKLKDNPNDKHIFLYSGSVFLKIFDDYDVVIISISQSSGSSENWYEYWGTAVSFVKNEELITAIYDYYYKIPTQLTRRVLENIKRNLYVDRYKFEDIIKSNSFNGLQLQGRSIIESYQNSITRDKNKSIRICIDDKNYTLCLTSYIESIYQLMDLGINDLFMVEINIRSLMVTMTHVSNLTDSFPNTLKPFIVYKRGIYTIAHVTFEIFFSLIYSKM